MTRRWHNTVSGPTWESSDPKASACHRSERTWYSSCKLDLDEKGHDSEVKCQRKIQTKQMSKPTKKTYCNVMDIALCTNLCWSCIPAYCTSWVFLVWKFSHRGCLALQPNPAHSHSWLHGAADPHHNSQSTAKSHTHSDNLVQPNYLLRTKFWKCPRCLEEILIIFNWPPPSPQPSNECRALDCRALCCLASVWCYSDEARGSTPAAPWCLHHSCQSTDKNTRI